MDNMTETLPSSSEDTAIQFNNLSFSYPSDDGKGEYALRGINLSVKKGEFLAVLGHNGSGKSTLARLCDGLLTPSAGEILIDKEEVNSKNLFAIRKKVGIVFQNPDNQTVASIVEDDIAFGPENIGVVPKEIGERINFALKAVGMEEFRHSMPARLSGGQKQRIAIAGVLALKPEIMILDEATAMLDPKGRKEVMEIVKKLNKEENITILYITHFAEEALEADRAIVLNRGEIVMQGNPEEILKNGEKLETYNLTLPRPVKICRALKEGGLNVSDTLSSKELANEIAKNLLGTDSLNEKNESIEDTSTYNFETKEESVVGGVGSIISENLSYVYNPNSPFETAALKQVNLTVKPGDFFGILGHTGSGKSTFVQHLNALIKLPTAEKKYKQKKKDLKRETPKTVLLSDGFDLTDKHTDFKKLRSKVGMVFQYPEYQLFAETIFQDVAFGLKNFASNPLEEEDIKNAVQDALQAVGLDYNEIKDKSPFELSGGQKRRVAIAGVIVSKPEILVLDEPAAGLDPLGKEQIMSLLHDLHDKWCKTIIIVSHDMDEIAENCTRVAVFSKGKVVSEETPKQLFSDPEKLYEIGLDVPFTAKVVESLKEKGVTIHTDFTSHDFVQAVLMQARAKKEVENA